MGTITACLAGVAGWAASAGRVAAGGRGSGDAGGAGGDACPVAGREAAAGGRCPNTSAAAITTHATAVPRNTSRQEESDKRQNRRFMLLFSRSGRARPASDAAPAGRFPGDSPPRRLRPGVWFVSLAPMRPGGEARAYCLPDARPWLLQIACKSRPAGGRGDAVKRAGRTPRRRGRSPGWRLDGQARAWRFAPRVDRIIQSGFAPAGDTRSTTARSWRRSGCDHTGGLTRFPNHGSVTR